MRFAANGTVMIWQVRSHVAKYAHADSLLACRALALTATLYLLSFAAYPVFSRHWALWWSAACLRAGLNIRMFIIFHDCCHGALCSRVGLTAGFRFQVSTFACPRLQRKDIHTVWPANALLAPTLRACRQLLQEQPGKHAGGTAVRFTPVHVMDGLGQHAQRRPSHPPRQGSKTSQHCTGHQPTCNCTPLCVCTSRQQAMPFHAHACA